MSTVEERFWSRVDRSDIEGCWPWIGQIDKDGYGVFKSSLGRCAHRISVELVSFEQIPRDKLACHKCDNRFCVNPNHIFLGTHKQNMQDCAHKDRLADGDDNGQSKLSEENVRKIKEIYFSQDLTKKKKTISQLKLAKIYGVNQSQIHRALYGKTWKICA